MNSLNPKVIIAPLDWGLGHATRCVPIIQYFIKKKWNVHLVSGPSNDAFLRAYFPELAVTEIPGYDVHYSSKNIKLSLISQIPKIQKAIKDENKWLQKHLKLETYDLIVSDNRYGLYSDLIPSVILTHQLQLKTPIGFHAQASKMIKKFLIKFDEIWIPDDPNLKLSGELGNNFGKELKTRFIGILSRFKKKKTEDLSPFEWVGVVSGPENQRSIFQDQLTKLFIESNKKCLIICGQPHLDFHRKEKNLELISHANDELFQNYVSSALEVFSRSGYSSMMDYLTLKVHATLIPTPGQSEQEYLAQYFYSKNWMNTLSQNMLCLEDFEQEQKSFSMPEFDPHLLEKELNDFLNYL